MHVISMLRGKYLFFREIAIIKYQIYVNFCIQMYYNTIKVKVLFIWLKFIGASHLMFL